MGARRPASDLRVAVRVFFSIFDLCVCGEWGLEGGQIRRFKCGYAYAFVIINIMFLEKYDKV